MAQAGAPAPAMRSWGPGWTLSGALRTSGSWLAAPVQALSSRLVPHGGRSGAWAAPQLKSTDAAGSGRRVQWRDVHTERGGQNGAAAPSKSAAEEAARVADAHIQQGGWDWMTFNGNGRDDSARSSYSHGVHVMAEDGSVLPPAQADKLNLRVKVNRPPGQPQFF
jgi:hypothetical protein